MLFGVSTASLYPMNTEDALLTLAEQGIRNIEIFLNSNLELHGELFNKIISVIKNYNLNILSFHPLPILDNLCLFSDYKRRKLEYLEIYKVYFEKMNLLGANILVLHGASGNNSCSNDRYFERFSELYNMGKEHGVVVAQENIHYCKSGNLEFLSEMSAKLGNDVSFVLDLKQAVRAGHTGFDVFDRIKGKIINVHASDSGEDGDCLPVGAGNFDFGKLLSELKSSGYGGGVIVELYSEDYESVNDLTQSVERLLKINEKINL